MTIWVNAQVFDESQHIFKIYILSKAGVELSLLHSKHHGKMFKIFHFLSGIT